MQNTIRIVLIIIAVCTLAADQTAGLSTRAMWPIREPGQAELQGGPLASADLRDLGLPSETAPGRFHLP